jgi:8-oxo-dGTP diphosphatase
MRYPEIKNRELHRIVSTAIIYRDEKYLITRRSLSKKAFPGQWTVPGGGLEIDDYAEMPPTTQSQDNDIWYFALEQSLRREIKEEVGVEVGAFQYLLDLTFVRSDNIPVLTFSFYAPWKSGNVALNDESINHAWITADEAKTYDLIAGIAQEIEMVDCILNGKDPKSVKF